MSMAGHGNRCSWSLWKHRTVTGWYPASVIEFLCCARSHVRKSRLLDGKHAQGLSITNSGRGALAESRLASDMGTPWSLNSTKHGTVDGIDPALPIIRNIP